MENKQILKYLLAGFSFVFINSCKVPGLLYKQEQRSVPVAFMDSRDTMNAADINWKAYFNDPLLIGLIDSALAHNQELNITLQEIEIGKNEVMAKKGEYLPSINFGAAAGPDRAGKYTWDGFSEEELKANPAKGPRYIGDFMAGAFFSWELDVWKKLRNSKKAATLRYLSSVEGKNFMVTHIIAEIAESYYELLALDNLSEIIRQNIALQKNALQVIRMEKDAAKVSQLAVNRFEAQMLYTSNLQYDVSQRITEAENRINFLVGQFPIRVIRNTLSFNDLKADGIFYGIPSQLMSNRPDIRQAELQLEAAKINVQVARANFLPSFKLTSGLAFQAYNPLFLINPSSIVYNLMGDMIAPLVNKNAIMAIYSNANSEQIQSVYNYERSVLNAHVEVVNQLSLMNNMKKSYETKLKEVEILSESILISNSLYRSARADYIEVLLTQREALEARIHLIEIKKRQLDAKVNLYKALGGGWR